EADERRRQIEAPETAVKERRVRLTQGDEPAPGMERRSRIVLLVGDACAMMLGRDREPRLFGGGEAGMRLVAAPGDRRPAAVATAELGIVGDAERIAQIGELERRLGQAELLALVE